MRMNPSSKRESWYYRWRFRPPPLAPALASHIHSALLMQGFYGGDGCTPCGELDERAAFRRPVRVTHAVDLCVITAGSVKLS